MNMPTEPGFTIDTLGESIARLLGAESQGPLTATGQGPKPANFFDAPQGGAGGMGGIDFTLAGPILAGLLGGGDQPQAPRPPMSGPVMLNPGGGKIREVKMPRRM